MNNHLIFSYKLRGFMCLINEEVYVYNGRIIINKSSVSNEIVLENVYEITDKIKAILNQKLFEEFEFEYDPGFDILDGTCTELELYTKGGMKIYSIDNFKLNSKYKNNKKFYSQISKIIKMINDYTKISLT